MAPGTGQQEAQARDLILRPIPLPGGSRQYLLVSIGAQAVVTGPFLNLGDAVIAAREIAIRERLAIWHEQVDDRGRVMGPLLRLFSGV